MRISDWSSDVCSSDLRKDIDAHPDQVFVVEVYVPATDTGAEHILKREDFTVYGLGEDVYDALWKNNPVKTGVRNRAIDYSRSYFMIAVMVAGVLQWRMVVRKSVVKGKSVSVRVDHGGRRHITNKSVASILIHYSIKQN